MGEMEVDSPVTILGLGGSLRYFSYSRRALLETLAAVREVGGETIEWTVDEQPLPLYDDDLEAPAAAQRLRQAAQRADGLLFASPEYHNGIAGVVKNAIDWLRPRDVRDKPIGIIVVGGGTAGGHRALTHLRQVARGLGAFAIPAEVSIANTDAIPPDGPWPDPATERHIQRLGREIARYAVLFRAIRTHAEG
ncbi:MAG: NAD(P)H-dependent oxidoreductase [Ardenticatenaceae bacterium]|nr:NAD(P)H-dependent oxidoreductase [Ardenticatenaceae bacterium]HBY95422.1 hypothetical protein [Chloroflexota bacterium]